MHVTFVDWLPGICSLLGMIVINLIDKDRVQGNEDFGDSRAVWRARLFLFIGFALMAGGLAGSVVSGRASVCFNLFGVFLVGTLHYSGGRSYEDVAPPRLPDRGPCALARSLKALLRAMGPLWHSNLSYTFSLACARLRRGH